MPPAGLSCWWGWLPNRLLRKLLPKVAALLLIVVELPLLLLCMLVRLAAGVPDGAVVIEVLMFTGVLLLRPVAAVASVGVGVADVGVTVAEPPVFGKSAFKQTKDEERDCCDRCALSLDEPLRDLGALKRN